MRGHPAYKVTSTSVLTNGKTSANKDDSRRAPLPAFLNCNFSSAGQLQSNYGSVGLGHYFIGCIACAGPSKSQ